MSHSLFSQENQPSTPAKQKVIILLGAPGSGKGTQAAYLREKVHLPHISTGDLFRENLKQNTPIGQKAKAYMDKGELVPDEVVMGMLFERIQKEDCKNGYILDGFPRTIAQAQALDKEIQSKADIIVINLEVPDKEIIDRLTTRRTCEKCSAIYNIKSKPPKLEEICDVCGGKVIQRKDDAEKVIQERLAVYHKQTAPLIGYYTEQKKLYTVDNTSSKEKTQAAIDQLLSKTLFKS